MRISLSKKETLKHGKGVWKFLAYAEGNFQRDLWRSSKRNEKVCGNCFLNKKLDYVIFSN